MLLVTWGLGGAWSSAEFEVRAVTHGICELLWLKRLLKGLKITSSMPMRLYCDNKVAINIAHNPIQHDRNKHVEVDHHFRKKKLEGLAYIPYIPTGEQVADILINRLQNGQFDNSYMQADARHFRASLRSVERYRAILCY